MPVTGGAVTGGAVLSVELRSAREIRSLVRRKWHGIGREKGRGQAMSYFRDLFRFGLVCDGMLQPGCLGQKGLSFWLRRQRRELFGDSRREFILFGIFGSTGDRTVLDRARVIDRDVVKQAPGRLNVARLRLRRPEEAESQHDEDSIAKRQRMQTDHNAPSNSRTVTLRSASLEAVQLEPF